MTLFYSEFSKVGILFLFSVFLASIILFLSYRLSTYNPDTEKVSAYECGFDPYEDARNVFDVRFYLVAILFLIFDLEAVYFFPWCVSLSFLNFTCYRAGCCRLFRNYMLFCIFSLLFCSNIPLSFHKSTNQPMYVSIRRQAFLVLGVWPTE